MKAAFLVFGALASGAGPQVSNPAPPSAPASTFRAEAKGKAPVLLGEVTAQAVLASRAKFRDNLARVRLTADLKARWQAVRHPCTLVAVFGSWCGDSHRQLPHLLALAVEPNPFIEVHYLGVARNKLVTAWPQGCPPQKVDRIPTFYLFTVQPGGHQKLVGMVVETPPKAGETMAEALVALLEDSVLAAGN